MLCSWMRHMGAEAVAWYPLTHKSHLSERQPSAEPRGPGVVAQSAASADGGWRCVATQMRVPSVEMLMSP